MAAGSIIQVPSLEKGDRLIVLEHAPRMPLAIPITYPDENENARTVRYVNIDDLPADLKKRCERYIRDHSD